MAEIDWAAVEEEALSHFRALLQLDTTNPPGNEALAARYLADVLAREGVAAEAVAPVPGRTSLVARLSGGNRGGALLLSSHTDVRAYAPLGIRTYGFTPLRLPPKLAFSKLFHGHDERVPVDAFRWGVRTFYEAVERFVTNPQ